VKIAIVLFDRFTALDAMGPYEVLSRLPEVDTVFVADRPEPVTNDLGSLSLVATHSFDAVHDPDVVVVPGGPGQLAARTSGPLIEWLQEVDKTTRWTTSVCTGALILGAAGFLTGRRATTHWLATDQLADFGATHAPERVVRDGKYITAAGVSAGLDMALNLAAAVAGDEAAQTAQLIIEYDPQPPFNAGSVDSAPSTVVQALEAFRDDVRNGLL